jgi:hypothetical protein
MKMMITLQEIMIEKKGGACGSIAVEALCYKPEGQGFKTR